MGGERGEMKIFNLIFSFFSCFIRLFHCLGGETEEAKIFSEPDVSHFLLPLQERRNFWITPESSKIQIFPVKQNLKSPSLIASWQKRVILLTNLLSTRKTLKIVGKTNLKQCFHAFEHVPKLLLLLVRQGRDQRLHLARRQVGHLKRVLHQLLGVDQPRPRKQMNQSIGKKQWILLHPKPYHL